MSPVSRPSAVVMRYGVKYLSKNARTLASFGGLSARAAAQTSFQIAPIADLAASVAQPARNEGHAAACGSPDHPGRSANAAGVNRATGCDVDGTVGARGGSGRVVQALKSAANAAAQTRWGRIAMIWFLLEALVALMLAVFIVWFTMGGRRSSPRDASAPKISASGKETDRP